ncbi:MAG: hypothetical protein ACO1O6_07230 [Bacteroidota bacterium]
MKKTVLSILAAVGLSLTAQATVRTVSNHVNSPGQYTSLQAAHDASASGDTLYIHASDVAYGNLTMDRSLVLIGEGALPDKQLQYDTHINTINLTYAAFPATTTAAGSKFYGLLIDQVYVGYTSSASTTGLGSITFSRNKLGAISLQKNHSNLLIYNNVINYMGQTSSTAGSLYNCVFSNNICTYFQPIISEGANNLISNNIFETYFNARGSVVSNNVFYNYTSNGTVNVSTISCTFSNNLFYAFNAVNPAIISGSNTGTGNLFDVDPVYTTPALGSQVYQYTYSNPANGPFANLHLQASSPGKNYGTDGTDIGLYGGSYPWVDGSATDSRYRYFTMPSQVPHMMEMNIINPALPVNGTLNVEFNAKTQN